MAIRLILFCIVLLAGGIYALIIGIRGSTDKSLSGLFIGPLLIIIVLYLAVLALIRKRQGRL